MNHTENAATNQPTDEFNLEEAAAYARLSLSTLQRALSAGAISYTKKRTRPTIARAQVDEWMTRRAQQKKQKLTTC
jgi:excisionase family DNA binding protein